MPGRLLLYLLEIQFTASQPDRYYVDDIAYVATWESWLYVEVAFDLFSRKVAGWSMANRMKVKLVNDALLIPKGTNGCVEA